MHTPCVDEIEVANEDENAATKDQNDRKPKGNVDDPYAECESCGALYTSHSKRNKMENMEAHLENHCDEYPFRCICCSGAEDAYKENLTLECEEEEEDVGENSESLDSTLTSGVFDAEVARILIAKMIIIDKLPLKFVKEEGFRWFLEQAVCAHNPEFEIPSLATVAKDILEIYKKEKKSLKNVFIEQGPRVSLTIDTWTSDQDINYIVLIGHFIDVNWKMQKRILNFRPIENHDGETIGKEVVRYLKKWGIKKILTLTVDNACSNDAAIAYIVCHFKNELVLDGKFVHVWCCAHILNLIVCDVMEDFHELISKIRNAVRFVRSTPIQFSSFEKCIKEEKISSKSVVCLDVPGRWDYTYMMLEGAEKFEKAFERLGIHDMAYLEEDIPSSRDWEVVRALVQFLSLFYNATLRLSGSLHVPANVVFDEISSIQNYIKKCSSNSDNLVLKDIAMKMQAKYDKYWGNNENANYLLYVAVVLDPRYKLKFLSYCFSELFEANVAKEMCKKVENVLRQLFNEYSLSIVKDSSTRGMARYSNAGESSTNDVTKAFRFKDMFDAMEEDTNLDAATEVDIYLLEPLVQKEENFDILKWWKYNSLRYKVLSKIAREMLAIPVSTVASESAFNISGGVIDSVSFSSAPNLVEVLACVQNWLNKDPTRIDLREHIEDIIRMEEDFETSLEEASTMRMGVGTMLGEKDD